MTDPIRAIFCTIVASRRALIAISFVLIIIAGAGLPKLEKDPSTDSLIPPDHESVRIRDYAEEIFGLRDPVVVAIVSDQAQGIFTPPGLATVARLHEEISAIENVRRDRVISIASESHIYAQGDALRIDPFMSGPPANQAEADNIRRSVFASALPLGTLVTQDGTGVLIIAEMVDQSLSDETYKEILALTDRVTDAQIQSYVAGQGAVSGYLSALIDTDSRRLPGIAVSVVFALIFLAFRRVAAIVAPVIVIIATVVGSIGLMAWLEISYFVITSALPIILIAIAVADAIHILTGFYARKARAPEKDTTTLVIDTMTDLWRPLTLTTLTTTAGFMGIGIASSMPPISYFGWFAALGSLIAWLFSLLVLPGVIVMLNPRSSPCFEPGKRTPISSSLTNIGVLTARAPVYSLTCAAVLFAIAAMFAAEVRVDRSQIENFRSGQTIRAADEVLNARFAGTSYLDVLVETDQPDGLINADRIKDIAALQDFGETLPFVTTSRSIVNVIEELHRAMSDDPQSALPSRDDAIGQYLLVYESSGDPTQLEDEIDYDYQRALVRFYMNSHYTSEENAALQGLSSYIEEHFSEDGITATIGGRVNVDFHWMKRLKESHFRSIIISATFIFIIASLLFRSAILGALALTPVLGAILAVYAVMGANGILIEPATSMFAAISIGVGVDFAIHFLDRLQKGVEFSGTSVVDAVKKHYPTSGRACFLNASALGFGFSVLMLSELPALFKFGMLIAVAASGSFIAGIALTTAGYALYCRRKKIAHGSVAQIASVFIGIALCAAAMTGDARAAPLNTESLSGREIAENVANRDDGDNVDRRIQMELIGRNGRTRKREARSLRLRGDDNDKSIIVFTAPSALRGTGFLTHDKDGNTDLRWLYLPSTGRPKQIPASDRGDYFLGTDFTYEDVANELKFDLLDYRFERTVSQDGDMVNSARVLAIPVNEKVARELGYGRVEALIDTEKWMPLSIDFFDLDGEALKTVTVDAIELIDGIWTPGRLAARRYKDDRQTIFSYSDVSYAERLNSSDFTPQALRRGLE